MMITRPGVFSFCPGARVSIRYARFVLPTVIITGRNEPESSRWGASIHLLPPTESNAAADGEATFFSSLGWQLIGPVGFFSSRGSGALPESPMRGSR